MLRSTLRRLHDSLGHLVRELVKFGIVGACAFVVDVGVFNVLRLGLEWGPLTCKTLSVFAAATFAYFGNRAWTFRHRAGTALRREYITFLVLNGVGLVISLAVLGVSHYVLEFRSPLADNVAANGVGLMMATSFRFWAYRRWVFPAVVEAAADVDRADAIAAHEHAEAAASETTAAAKPISGPLSVDEARG